MPSTCDEIRFVRVSGTDVSVLEAASRSPRTEVGKQRSKLFLTWPSPQVNGAVK